MLVLIGPRWIGIADEAGRRRLEDPHDFVRLEIRAALNRNCRIVPILLEGATMVRGTDLPGELAPLARLNAVEVRDTHFNSDVAQLIAVIGRKPWLHQLKRTWKHAAAAALIVAASLAAWQYKQAQMSPIEARTKLAQVGLAYTEEAFVGRAGRDDAEAVHLFLQAGMTPNAEDDGTTVLEMASSNARVEVVKALLDKGAQVTGNSLRRSVSKDRKETFAVLLRQQRLDAATLNGVLCHAATFGRTELAAELLRIGTDPNAKTVASENGYTPLMCAAAGGRPDTVRFLLDRAVDIHTTRGLDESDAWTALHAATAGTSYLNKGSDSEYEAVVRDLLGRGAEVDLRGRYVNSTKGWTPLLVAIHEGKESLAMLLLEHGADVNARCEWHGHTPLTMALDWRSKRAGRSLIQALLAKKADVDAVDERGWTPLMIAADNGDAEMSQLLIEHGANVDARTPKGYTALNIAQGKRDDRASAVIRLLSNRRVAAQ